MKILISALLILSVFAFQDANAAMDKVVCYYGSWATYRHGLGQFHVEHIDPRLCTHLIYTFVGLDHDASVRVMDPYNDLEENWGKGAFKRFNQLKNQNPNLKTIIAIGGWNEGSETYSRVMEDPELRAKFVRDAVNFTVHYGFDGFDFDWEYPNQRGGRPMDVENFITVLSELRTELDKHGLLLTAAVAAAEFSASLSYNIPELNKYLDFINVMAYDLHGPWDVVTGHNAPLYPSSKDITEKERQLNVVACIDHWIAKGADPSKIILGMGMYGRTFTLDNPSQNGIGAPARQPGNAGPYTNQPGMIGYNEILEWQGQGGWTVVWEDEQEVPYMYKGNQWIGYDNPASIRRKVQFAEERGLGGCMIWSIETDDFHGLSGIIFGLLHAINDEMGNDIPSVAPTIPPPTSTTPSPGEGGSNGVCTAEGLVPNEEDCSAFYQCVRTTNGFKAYPFKCTDGLFFDPVTSTCNYPWNVNCSSVAL